ncbi:hypothetical protein V6N12_019919 [Hibiscus sabdariffa]|uniref:Uncharacterized protein n=1 Tax=Hibiscus sabdariffa TaxID=183260 RepID=A0ABR1ZI79_9ROSI
MLSETWQLNSPIVSNIGRFQASASKWKRDSFGHIGKWKHVLMARIRGIESVNERSRAQWVLDGDQNTKYRVTKAQHCRKVCSMIKLGDGKWCLGPALIRDEVVDFFKSIFYHPQ